MRRMIVLSKCILWNPSFKNYYYIIIIFIFIIIIIINIVVIIIIIIIIIITVIIYSVLLFRQANGKLPSFREVYICMFKFYHEKEVSKNYYYY